MAQEAHTAEGPCLFVDHVLSLHDPRVLCSGSPYLVGKTCVDFNPESSFLRVDCSSEVCNTGLEKWQGGATYRGMSGSWACWVGCLHWVIMRPSMIHYRTRDGKIVLGCVRGANRAVHTFFHSTSIFWGHIRTLESFFLLYPKLSFFIGVWWDNHNWKHLS